MPITLIEFSKLANIESKKTCIDNMLHVLNLKAPFEFPELKSPYSYDRYNIHTRQKSVDQLAKAILDNIFRFNMSLIPELEITCAKLSKKINPENVLAVDRAKVTKRILKIKMLYFLITNCALFEIFNHGNCAERASFAAIRLFEILRETDIKVSLQAMKTKDHIAVLLGPIDDRYYVYDPLINPEILIEHAEFNHHIAASFKDQRSKQLPFKLIINAKTYTIYQQKIDEAKTNIVQEIQNITVEKLMADKEFNKLCTNYGYSDPHLYAGVELLLSKSFLSFNQTASFTR